MRAIAARAAATARVASACSSAVRPTNGGLGRRVRPSGTGAARRASSARSTSAAVGARSGSRAAVPCRARSDRRARPDAIAGAAGRDLRLAQQHVRRPIPSNGSRPGQRLVERDADGVPVAGVGRRGARACSGDMYAAVPPTDSPPAIGRKPSAIRPKSRITTRPCGGDQHVGRLDVAVQLARGVQPPTPSTSCRERRRSRSAARRGVARRSAHAVHEVLTPRTSSIVKKQSPSSTKSS